MAITITADLTKMQASFSPNIDTSFNKPIIHEIPYEIDTKTFNSDVSTRFINRINNIDNINKPDSTLLLISKNSEQAILTKIILPGPVPQGFKNGKSFVDIVTFDDKFAANPLYRASEKFAGAFDPPRQQVNIPQTINQLTPTNIPLPGIGGASLAGIATAAIGIASPAAASALSVVNYFANLPLSLYRRPDGILTVGAIAGEILFNCFMTRNPHKFGDPDYAFEHGVERVRAQHASSLGLGSSIIGSILAMTGDVPPFAYGEEFWYLKEVYFIDKFQLTLSDRLPVRNIHHDFFKKYSNFDVEGNLIMPWSQDPGSVNSKKYGNGPYLDWIRQMASETSTLLWDNKLWDLVEGVGGVLTANAKDAAFIHSNIGNTNKMHTNYPYATSTYEQLQRRARGDNDDQASEYDSLGFQDFREDYPDHPSKIKGIGSANIRKSVAAINSKYFRDPVTNPIDDKKIIDPLLDGTSNDDFVILKFGGIQFRSYIISTGQSWSPGWNSIKYLGRPQPLKILNEITRNANIEFLVVALSRAELKPIYSKLDQLAKLVMPGINPNGNEFISPYFNFKVGDFIDDTAIINSLNYNVEQEWPWEVNLERSTDVGELPHIVRVSADIEIIGREALSTNTNTFNLDFGNTPPEFKTFELPNAGTTDTPNIQI